MIDNEFYKVRFKVTNTSSTLSIIGDGINTSSTLSIIDNNNNNIYI
jgi:hypothetical protein